MLLTTGTNLIAAIPAIILCVKFSDSLRIFLPAASFLFLVAVTVVAFATEDDAFYAVALMVYCVPACLIGLVWAIRAVRARPS